VVFGAVLVASSCGGDVSTASEGSAEIVVDLERNDRWTAAGSFVDDGLLCARGARYLVTRFDPDTGRTVWQWVLEDKEEARSGPTDPLDVVFVREYSCDDGTGSFTVEEYPPDRTWTVVSGTGAYSSMVGQGSFSVTRDERAVPSEEYVIVEFDFVR